MSRSIILKIQNNSSYAIKSYAIVHSWNDHTDILSGTDLAKGGTMGKEVTITSGYVEFDWYTVQIVFDVNGSRVRQTDFYCNSSKNDTVCVMEIGDNYVNCNYSNIKGEDTGSCKHKKYSMAFEDEQKQTDPKKIAPTVAE